jgi:hypothetical protein
VTTEKLTLLCVLGALLLNYPVLAIFNRETTEAGVPVLYLYLFGMWVAAIAAVFVLARRRWSGED